MSEYYFIFVWLAAMGFISMNMPVKERTKVLGKIEMRWKVTWAIAVFLPVIHLASMGTPRSDTELYISMYTNSEATWSTILSHLQSHESGFGYRIFQDTVKIISGGSVSAFRIILALCHIVPVILVFRKYSSEYLFSAFLFVATGCHIGWMMNGLRQFLAVSIIFIGTGFIVRKRLIPAIALILIATSVHTAAIVMLPVVFIVQGKAWNKKTMLYIVAAVIAMFVFSRRAELMDTLLQGTEYEGAVSNWRELGDDGAHPVRVLVNAVPTILAFYARRTIDRKNEPFLNVCVNMSVINLGIYLVAMVTSGIMIGRLPGYTSLYTYLLLPYLIFRVEWGNYNMLLRGGAIVGYFLYYLIQYRGFV